MVRTPRSLKITSSDQVDAGVLLTSDIANAEFNVADKLVKLDGSADIPLAQIPDTLTGKDSDTVDGEHAASFEEVANKNAVSGYAGLNSLTEIPLSILPGVSRLSGSLAVGSDIYHAHDDTVSTTSTSYVIKKTITLNHLPAATMRISLTLTEDYNSQWVKGTIYRNGGAVGTERSRSSVGSSTWEEDIAGWSKGDTLELWLKVLSGLWSGKGSNFRILGALAETELSNS